MEGDIGTSTDSKAFRDRISLEMNDASKLIKDANN